MLLKHYSSKTASKHTKNIAYKIQETTSVVDTAIIIIVVAINPLLIHSNIIIFEVVISLITFIVRKHIQ
mgnify:CR=1 FL=1